MYTSQTFTKVAAALLNVQKSMGSSTKGSVNPYFKSRYADLNAVLEACKDILNENGLVVLQPHSTTDKGDFVETVLLHESGEWISSITRIEVVKQNDPQALGSAITYARRYGLQSMLSIPAEDDDGENAMQRKPMQTGYAKTSSATTQTKASVTTMTNNVTNITTPVKVTETSVAKTPSAVLPATKTSFRKPTNSKVSVAQTVVSDDIV